MYAPTRFRRIWAWRMISAGLLVLALLLASPEMAHADESHEKSLSNQAECPCTASPDCGALEALYLSTGGPGWEPHLPEERQPAGRKPRYAKTADWCNGGDPCEEGAVWHGLLCRSNS